MGKLDNLYSLHSDFAIIGVTGRIGAGCSEIVKKLADKSYLKDLDKNKSHKQNSDKVDILKYNISLKYLKQGDNWKPFTIIKYTNVLLFHLIYECCYERSKSEAKTTFSKSIFTYNGKQEFKDCAIWETALAIGSAVNGNGKKVIYFTVNTDDYIDKSRTPKVPYSSIISEAVSMNVDFTLTFQDAHTQIA